MPTGERREDNIIRLFLSAYENNLWVGIEPEWPDKTSDGGIDATVTKGDRTLAIEHTLIEPFVGDKEDFVRFWPLFLRIHEDKSLIVPGRVMYVFFPTGILRNQKRSSAEAIARGVHEWLAANRLSLPEGSSQHSCRIVVSGGLGFDINLNVRVEMITGSQGLVLIRRQAVANNLGEIVEKALRTKLPKLVNTDADRHLLLLERDQLPLSEKMICHEIDKQRPAFPELSKVDEIWFVETVFFENDKAVRFELFDADRGLVRSFQFHEGRLIGRSENGMPLPVSAGL